MINSLKYLINKYLLDYFEFESIDFTNVCFSFWPIFKVLIPNQKFTKINEMFYKILIRISMISGMFCHNYRLREPLRESFISTILLKIHFPSKMTFRQIVRMCWVGVFMNVMRSHTLTQSSVRLRANRRSIYAMPSKLGKGMKWCTDLRKAGIYHSILMDFMLFSIVMVCVNEWDMNLATLSFLLTGSEHLIKIGTIISNIDRRNAKVQRRSGETA